MAEPPTIAAGPHAPSPRAKAAAAIAVAFAVVLLVYWVRNVLFLTFFGLLLGIAVSAIGGAGTRWLRLPHGLAVTLATLLIFAAVGGMLALLAAPLSEQTARLSDELPGHLDRLERAVRGYRDGNPGLARFIPDTSGLLSLGAGASATKAAWTALAAVSVALGGAVNLLTIFFLALFFALEPERYLRGAAMLIPGPEESHLALFSKIGAALREWMTATVIDMAVVALLWGLGLWVIGIKYYVLFGVIGGFFQIVPYYGPALGFVPPLLIALASGGHAATAVTILYGLIQLGDSYVLYPFLLSQQADLPPVLVLVAISALGAAFGFWGILLAVPLLTVGYVVVNEVYLKPDARAVVVVPGDHLVEEVEIDGYPAPEGGAA
jgi:predicted PurR-regulated permease PerM